VTDVWSERAAAYRESAAHREGPDLDVLVEWARDVQTALDVATGGGHTARVLREAGVNVVTCDPAPGMQPDVICRAESLPFADASFEVVVSRVAAHHYEDVAAAVREMARVASRLVLVVDNLYGDETLEEAERARDPSHVRNYSEEEWRSLFERAGLRVDEVRFFDKPIELEPWLERAGCTGEEAERVRTLARGRIRDGWIHLDRIAVKGVKQ
jgi:SAM-dependent methyltransferase